MEWRGYILQRPCSQCQSGGVCDGQQQLLPGPFLEAKNPEIKGNSSFFSPLPDDGKLF